MIFQINEIDVSSIVNKACEENCELNTQQTVMIQQRIHYLRMAYLNILDSDINQPVVFGECCKKAITQIIEIGIKVIKNYKTIMQQNRVFRVNKMFPIPIITLKWEDQTNHFS